METRLSGTPTLLMLFLFWIFVQKYMEPFEASADSVENWPWVDNEPPRLEQVLEGKDITLRCAGRIEDAAAHWDYKPCGNYPRISCLEVINNEKVGLVIDEWMPLTSTKNTISLVRVSHTDSGLYRCREAASAQINVYTTIELEVIGYAKEQEGDLPQFMESLPSNITVAVNSQEVFRCKVSSFSQLTIIWLQEGPGPLNYQGQSYIPINSSGEMKLAENVYLSKMVIYKVLPRHAGRYYCLAVNTKGYSNISMLLSVIDFKGEDLDIGCYSMGHSVYYLFLIPVALASVPVTIWLCFFCLRRKVYTEEDGSIVNAPYAYGNVNRVKSYYYDEIGRTI